MPGRYLLDTNIIISLFAGESSVKDHLSEATRDTHFHEIEHLKTALW